MPLIVIVSPIPHRCVFVILALKGVYANHSHNAPPIEIVGVSGGLTHLRGVQCALRSFLNSAERPPSFRLSVRCFGCRARLRLIRLRRSLCTTLTPGSPRSFLLGLRPRTRFPFSCDTVFSFLRRPAVAPASTNGEPCPDMSPSTGNPPRGAVRITVLSVTSA